jgi:paraquat-inducible protein B
MNELATRPPPPPRPGPEGGPRRPPPQVGGPAVPPPPPPAAEVRRSRGLSLVWLVPLVAAVLAGWLAWTTWANQGTTIRITFETAEGLEAGATKVKYREVDIGTVELVQIGADLERVVVTARMVKGSEAFLTSGTRYWIVRPRVGTGGVSGLGTLVSGAYIGVDPGPGEPAREFAGLEEPPPIRSDVPGKRFTLRADRLGSVSRGAPIYYRGIEVGQVLGYDLLDGNSDALRISVFVRDPYDDLVHRETRFWNASGVSLGTGGGGLQVRLASVQALLVGGLEFETPPAAVATEEAPPGTEFYLFPDQAAADRANYSRRQPYVVEFEGSARGLGRHAPVEVRGIQVGTVDDVRLAYERGRGQFTIQAVVNIAPERVAPLAAGTGEAAPPEAVRIEDLVARGLRAQLRTGNLLTGDLYVELDFFPDAPPAEMRQVGDLKAIPAVPTELETLQASATAVLEKLAALPLPELVQSLTNTAKGLEATVTRPETQQAIANLSASMAALRGTLERVDGQVVPLVASLKGTSDAAAATLREAQQAFASVGPDSRLGGELRSLVDELQRAARSIRVFADYLERNPEALIRGRRGGYQ